MRGGVAEDTTWRRVSAFQRRIDGRREKCRAIGALAGRGGEEWWGKQGVGSGGGLLAPVGETSPTHASGA